MIGWAVLAVYVAGFIMTWRRAAWYVLADATGQYNKPDDVDVVMSVFTGFCIALFWPMVVPVSLWVRRGTFFSLPRREQLRRLQEDIERLERETRD